MFCDYVVWLYYVIMLWSYIFSPCYLSMLCDYIMWQFYEAIFCEYVMRLYYVKSFNNRLWIVTIILLYYVKSFNNRLWIVTIILLYYVKSFNNRLWIVTIILLYWMHLKSCNHIQLHFVFCCMITLCSFSKLLFLFIYYRSFAILFRNTSLLTLQIFLISIYFMIFKVP